MLLDGQRRLQTRTRLVYVGVLNIEVSPCPSIRMQIERKLQIQSVGNGWYENSTSD